MLMFFVVICQSRLFVHKSVIYRMHVQCYLPCDVVSNLLRIQLPAVLSKGGYALQLGR